MFLLPVSGAGKPQHPFQHPAGLVSWSPDGKKLVFTAPDNITGPLARPGPVFHIANADGSGEVALDDHGEWPRWSPSGDRIAFDKDGKIYVAGSDGAGSQQVTSDLDWMCRKASWSPRIAKRIAFSCIEAHTCLGYSTDQLWNCYEMRTSSVCGSCR